MMHLSLLNKVFNFSAERYLKTAGDLFIYEADYESALDMVEKTLEIDPGDVRALVLKGDILYCLNRDNDALDALNAALNRNPNSVEALISKAGVLDVLGHYREALSCCLKAFSLIQPYQNFLLPSLYDQNIALYLRLKKFRQAQQLLREASTHLPSDEYHYLLTSYAPMLDRLSQKRTNAQKTAKRLALKVLDQKGAAD